MIEENTSRVLVLEVGALDWERLALTQAQVTQYNLPTIVKHDRLLVSEIRELGIAES
jgi:hypothetical protein